LPILRTEPRPGNHRVGDQGRFCNIVGGVASPLLANIYIDRLDRFVEEALIPEFTRGKRKGTSNEYSKVYKRMRRLTEAGKAAEAAEQRKILKTISPVDHDDPNFRRLRYIRYADDCAPGNVCSR
jgi:hypothetical protein